MSKLTKIPASKRGEMRFCPSTDDWDSTVKVSYLSPEELEAYKTKGVVTMTMKEQTTTKIQEGQDFFKNEGMAIFIKGVMVLGVHPNNLEDNLNNLKNGNLRIDWERFGKRAGVVIEEIKEQTNTKTPTMENERFDELLKALEKKLVAKDIEVSKLQKKIDELHEQANGNKSFEEKNVIAEYATKLYEKDYTIENQKRTIEVTGVTLAKLTKENQKLKSLLVTEWSDAV